MLHQHPQLHIGSLLPSLRQKNLIVFFLTLLNPYMKLSLISEGELYTDDGWVITGQDGQKVCTPPSYILDEPIHAHIVGKLGFWPQDDVITAISECTTGLCMVATQDEMESECLGYLSESGSEDCSDDELPMEGWRHREYYAPARKPSYIEQPNKQLGSRATKYGPQNQNSNDQIQYFVYSKILIMMCYLLCQ